MVGQTPPPFGGQAIMQKMTLAGRYNRIHFYHVRMAFSKEMDEVGRFQVKKIVHLLYVILTIIWMRFRHGIGILYYPPAGPNRIPIYRDMAILICTRWLFKKVIFHFHASGISEIYPELTRIEKFAFRIAYFRPNLTISPSEFNPKDGLLLDTCRDVTIPNGIPDFYPAMAKNKENPLPVILFVGIMRESKGVLVTLDACRLLQESGHDFQVKMMGKFDSMAFEGRVQKFVEQHGIEDKIEFLGVCTGKEKWSHFANADIFCFPSFYENESFGLVILEAMQFCLPVVTTRWRGIPSLIEQGVSGYMVAPRDSNAVAEKLSLLLNHPELRKKMGEKGRHRYLEHYTIGTFYKNLENAVLRMW